MAADVLLDSNDLFFWRQIFYRFKKKFDIIGKDSRIGKHFRVLILKLFSKTLVILGSYIFHYLWNITHLKRIRDALCILVFSDCYFAKIVYVSLDRAFLLALQFLYP